MEYITDEFVTMRINEPLEEQLRVSKDFRETQREWGRISQMLNDGIEQTAEYRRLQEEWESKNSEHKYLCGKAAYVLGYEDGIKIASEHQIRQEKSILSVQDMAQLIYVYDAIKKLNKIMCGEVTVYQRDKGLFGTMERVVDVIAGGAASEVIMLGKDEFSEYLTRVLNNEDETPEKRARELVGMQQV